jgi:Mg2+-importing ATPase
MVVGLLLPFTRFGSSLGLQPLPPVFFGWLVLILIAYAGLAQAVKTFYVRRYGYN